MMSELERLLPCPFCGGKAERITIGDDEPDNAGGDVICCTQCQASSHVEFGRKENLVSRWNTRAQSARIAALEDALGERMERLPPEFEAAIFDNLEGLYEESNQPTAKALGKGSE
jgi:Lar family restriction alleviation protein